MRIVMLGLLVAACTSEADGSGETGGGSGGATGSIGGSGAAEMAGGSSATGGGGGAGATTGGSGGGGFAPQAVLSRVDCGEAGEHFPLCGAASNFGIDDWLGSEIDFDFRPGDGPNGRWAVELHHLQNSSDVGEGYFGWNFSESNGCDVSQGERCVVRWWFKTLSPQQTGDFGSKLFILGDNDGEDGDRIIGTWRQWCDGDCYTFDVDKNIDGIGPNFVDPVADTWHSVQVVAQSSSTVGALDGSLRIYLDEDDVDSPTSETTGVSLVATWNGPWGFGMFRNMEEDGAHVRYQVYCVELARDFDDTFRQRTQIACR